MTESLFVPPIPPHAPYRFSATANPVHFFQLCRRMARNPLEAWTDEHYTLPFLQGRLFGQHMITVNDPEMVRHVFVTHADNYALTYLRKKLLGRVLRNGLIAVEGPVWKRTRQALTPVFTPRHISGFADTMHRLAMDHTSRLVEKNGITIPITEEMLSLTLNILVDSLFSEETDFDRTLFSTNVTRVQNILGLPHIFDFMQLPEWAPRFGQSGAQIVIKALQDQMATIIEQRRHKLAAGKEVSTDFLSLLLQAGLQDQKTGMAGLTNDEIVDNLLTFLIAGHETTARALAWTFYLLSQAPKVAEQLEAEIDTAPLAQTPVAKWTDILPFTVAVLKESMRLYPPAPATSRLAINADRIGDLDIPAGAEIYVAPWLLHRHRQLWRDPDSFDPTRFLGEEGQSINRYAYIPFGLGPRVCIGAQFAMMEAVISLATIISKLRFTYVGDEPPMPIMRITLQPSNTIPMRVETRTKTMIQ